MAGALERACEGRGEGREGSRVVRGWRAWAHLAWRMPCSTDAHCIVVGRREKRGGKSAWMARLGAPRTALLPCSRAKREMGTGNRLHGECHALRMPTALWPSTTFYLLLPTPYLRHARRAQARQPRTTFYPLLPSPYLINLRSSSRGSVSMVSVSERMLSASPRFRWCSALTLSSIVLIACRW